MDIDLEQVHGVSLLFVKTSEIQINEPSEHDGSETTEKGNKASKL